MVESEPVSSVSENKPVKDDFDLLAGPVRESPVEVKSDFDLLNGDQFNDSKSVTDLKKDITGTWYLRDENSDEKNLQDLNHLNRLLISFLFSSFTIWANIRLPSF